MLQANVRLITEGHLREARLNPSKLRRTSTVIRNSYDISIRVELHGAGTIRAFAVKMGGNADHNPSL